MLSPQHPAPSQSSRPSPRTAAKSQSRKRAASQDPVTDLVAEIDVKQESNALPVEDATFAKLQERRLWPGAATSEADFSSFFTALSEANIAFQAVPAEPVDTSDTILYKVQLWTDRVRAELGEDAPDYLVRLAVGVLAFGRSRQADLFLREHALIYWIAEGGKTLRFHAGDCYMKTPSGAFQQHRGIPPDHDRVQAFLMHVEGIFRLMPRNTARSTEGFLRAIKVMWEKADGLAPFVTSCVDACLRFEGDSGPRRGAADGGGGGLPGHDDEDVGPAPPQNAWNASTAKTIMAVKKQLSIELTQDKLLHYMSEWCEMPKKLTAAVCYEDCAITYEDPSLPAVQVSRAALENCYLRIPHCIKGTVPQATVERLQQFYFRTFWSNLDVFRCGQAAQALAKRGLNVVRLFIGLSSGGVGQSLYSTHLQAMYGHNFAFFDPQIWFHEEEMRKQVEQLNGCIILTGQETPGTGRISAARTRVMFTSTLFHVPRFLCRSNNDGYVYWIYAFLIVFRLCMSIC